MNKNDFVTKVAEKTNFSKKDVEAMLKASQETVKDALKKGESIQFVGFGTFSVTKRAAKTGINPRTKSPIKIPATKCPKFKPGKSFKEAIQ